MELLYDDTENLLAQHVCLITEEQRYDFSFLHSSLFFGKSMVICLQSNKMILLSSSDLGQDIEWAHQLNITDEDISEIKQFFLSVLDTKEIRPEEFS
jgi:hypothetical protein